MFFQHRAFWIAKDAERADQFQDAFAVDAFRGAASIADGVSSSLFASSWAELLTRAVIADPPDVGDEELLGPWLDQHRKEWLEPIDVDNLAWHQKPKFQANGAQTTLLWVELYKDSTHDRSTGEVDMYAYSVGDCCLFHIRGDRMLRSFPFSNAEAFASNPAVIGSISKKSDVAIPFEHLQTTGVNDDLLVLCTDAMAVWLLEQKAAGVRIDWNGYWSMTESDWRDHILDLRQNQQIRYDDTTMLLLRLGKKEPAVTTEE
ncbi:hypothetical protein Pla8534_10330 [Lignipirellula cremea]|uniref:Protein phosphatase 2C n=2 Tax=Lignipirellula cremea TaxID=2528010 RepID=A0A518DN37_9BACT|nr:hypothetical protein Pla8534_10330 [Lignipirellula cremea]